MPVLVPFGNYHCRCDIFLIQNTTPVSVFFLFWRFEASLAIVFLSVVIGIVITAVIAFSGWIRHYMKR